MHVSEKNRWYQGRKKKQIFFFCSKVCTGAKRGAIHVQSRPSVECISSCHENWVIEIWSDEKMNDD